MTSQTPSNTATEIDSNTNAVVQSDAIKQFERLVRPSARLRPFFAALTITLFIAVATFAFYSQWKVSSRMNSFPLESRDIVGKVSTFLANKSDPDYLLLGSSVFLVPAVYCDEAKNHRPFRAGESDYSLQLKVMHCTTAPELKSDIEERTHKPVSVVNLAVAASNVSDYLHEVKALHEAGHKPSMVICGLGVRDFVQSFWHMQADQSPVAKLLGDHDLARTELSETTLNDIRSECINLLSRDYKLALAHAQTYFTEDSAPMILPKTDEQMAAKMIAAMSDKPKEAGFIESQLTAYEHLLQYCNQNNIPLFIVEVSKRSSWDGVLDPNTVKRIETKIVSDCAKFKIPYANEKQGFTESDFEDDIHPNAQGGIKLFDKIAASVTAKRG